MPKKKQTPGARKSAPTRRRAPPPPRAPRQAKSAWKTPQAAMRRPVTPKKKAGAGFKTGTATGTGRFLTTKGPRVGQLQDGRVTQQGVEITSFKANGGMSGFRTSKYDAFTYASLSAQVPKGLVNGPGVFYSQEALFLGQVNFPGRVPLHRILELLNRSLQLRDKRGNLFDFRDVYDRWSYTYQIFRKQGVKREIVSRIEGSNNIGRRKVRR